MTATPSSSPPAAPRPPRRGWRARAKSGWIGLAVALLLGWVFTVWPQLDLWTSAQFHAVGGTFVGDQFAFVRFLYRGIPVSGKLYAAIGVIVIVVSFWRPHPIGGRWSRRLVALAWVSLLGSGLLVNAGLKEYWGRARPVQVSQFGGQQQFSPALSPTDQCHHNCSFVSGHATSGYILMAVGLMGSVTTRRRWLWIGLAWGAVVSAARISEGGHFLSDTLFAGVAVWGSGWLVRELWLRAVALRWRRLRQRRLAAAA
jgi:lipid A 4'-phosphatase